jgi:hypothetical protein
VKKKSRVVRRKRAKHPSGVNISAQANQSPLTPPSAESDQIDHASINLGEFVAYNENLLERSRTQWQFGDWESLAKLERNTLQHHPDRAKLALLAAAGYIQLGDSNAARQFTRLAQDWGCSKKLISQLLISGVHNTLGRAAVVSGQQPRALKHFENAIAIGTPGSEVRLITPVRLNNQLNQLGLKNEENAIVFSKTNRLSIDTNLHSQYCIDSRYQSRTKYTHYDDMEEQDKWQLEVYLYAYAIMKKNNFIKIVDYGCGSGYKLITFFDEFETIGYELPANVDILKKHYAEREWRVSDFYSNEIIDVDIIICSDVIEHLVDPDILINFFLKQKFKYLVLSTPEKDLVYAENDPHRLGPPRNIAHQREWNFQEFAEYIGSTFQIIQHSITNAIQATQMIVCVKK